MRGKSPSKSEAKARRRAMVSEGARKEKRKKEKAAWANSLGHEEEASWVIIRRRRGMRMKSGKRKLLS